MLDGGESAGSLSASGLSTAPGQHHAFVASKTSHGRGAIASERAVQVVKRSCVDARARACGLAASLCALTLVIALLTRTPSGSADGSQEFPLLRTDVDKLATDSVRAKPGGDAASSSRSGARAEPVHWQPASSAPPLSATLPDPVAEASESRGDASASGGVATPAVDLLPLPSAASEVVNLVASSASPSATETPLAEPSAQVEVPVAASSSGTSAATPSMTTTVISTASGTVTATATSSTTATATQPQAASRAVNIAAAEPQRDGRQPERTSDLPMAVKSMQRDGSVEQDDHDADDDSENSKHDDELRLPVPAIIHTAWHSKTLPRGMRASVKALMEANPEFELRLYNVEDQQRFLSENFPAEVLAAYNALRPQAFKSDLFRYALLWKVGGIWIDSKLTLPRAVYPYDLAEEERSLPGFSFSQMRSQGHLGFDRTWHEGGDLDDPPEAASPTATTTAAPSVVPSSQGTTVAATPSLVAEVQDAEQHAAPAATRLGVEEDASLTASGDVVDSESSPSDAGSGDSGSTATAALRRLMLQLADDYTLSDIYFEGDSESEGDSEGDSKDVSEDDSESAAKPLTLESPVLPAASPASTSEAGARMLTRRNSQWNDGRQDILMSFMVLQPGCPLMHAAIIAIVQHVKDRFMGRPGGGFLDITGPALLMALYNMRPELVPANVAMDLDDALISWTFAIRWRGKVILRPYKSYRAEQHSKGSGPHYAAAWFTGPEAVFGPSIRANGKWEAVPKVGFYGGFDAHLLSMAATTALKAVPILSGVPASKGGWTPRLTLPSPMPRLPNAVPSPAKSDVSERYSRILDLATSAIDRRTKLDAEAAAKHPPEPLVTIPVGGTGPARKRKPAYWELPHVKSGFYTGATAVADAADAVDASGIASSGSGSGRGSSQATGAAAPGPSRNIFLTWPTQELPPGEQAAVAALRSRYVAGAGAAAEPEDALNVTVLDDAGARELIAQLYAHEPEVLWAFDALLPGAYRANLIAYAVLHAIGGVYVDMSHQEAADGAIGALVAAGRARFAVETVLIPGPRDVCKGINAGMYVRAPASSYAVCLTVI